MSKRTIIRILVVLAIAMPLGLLYIKYRVPPTLAFSDLPLEKLDGTPVNLNEYKGKVIFLNFWKTWCGPCREEMPSIEKARQLTDSSNIVFIAVSDEDPAKIAAFQQQHNYRFLILHSKKDFSSIGINSYPTSYIINRDGEIELDKVGGADWADAETIKLFKQLAE
jgi:thiol-disulfide isomerase/thioredoxin